MEYWFGYNLGEIVFQGYKVETIEGLICTCISLISLAILLEAIKVRQVFARQHLLSKHIKTKTKACNNECALLLEDHQDALKTPVQRMKFLLMEVLWYLINICISYILMLFVMTYNGYFTISAVLGAGLGYFLFSSSLLNVKMLNPAAVCPECKAKCELLVHKEGQNVTEESSTPPLQNLSDIIEEVPYIQTVPCHSHNSGSEVKHEEEEETNSDKNIQTISAVIHNEL